MSAHSPVAGVLGMGCVMTRLMTDVRRRTYNAATPAPPRDPPTTHEQKQRGGGRQGHDDDARVLELMRKL